MRDPAVLADLEGKHADNDAMSEFRRRKGVKWRDLFTPSEMEQLAARLGSTSAVDDMLSGAGSKAADATSGAPALIAQHTILSKAYHSCGKKVRHCCHGCPSGWHKRDFEPGRIRG